MNRSKVRGLVAILFSLGLTAALLSFITFVKNLPPPLVVEATKDNFDDLVMKSSLPVFLEFYKKNDPYCKLQEPIVQKVAKDYDGKVRFVKLDVDKYPSVADQIGVGYVPMLFLVKAKERLLSYSRGPLPEKELREFIDRGVARKPTPAVNPAPKPATPPAVNPAPKPATPPAVNPAPKPATPPAVNPAPKPATPPAVKPDPKPATPPAVSPDAKPATPPVVKPDPKPATPPVVNPDSKPAPGKISL